MWICFFQEEKAKKKIKEEKKKNLTFGKHGGCSIIVCSEGWEEKGKVGVRGIKRSLYTFWCGEESFAGSSFILINFKNSLPFLSLFQIHIQTYLFVSLICTFSSLHISKYTSNVFLIFLQWLRRSKMSIYLGKNT